jgi:tRNA(Arg) A34 adenosine deaminase TadA
MSRNERILAVITESALCSQMNFRHGTIITKGSSKPIFRGFNTPRSKYMNYINYCQHAEMHVASKLYRHLQKKCLTNTQLLRLTRKYIIWVGRISKNNDITHSKPCKQCRVRLLRMGFKKIGYTDENSIIHLVNIHTIMDDNLSNCQRRLFELKWVSHKSSH